MFPDLGLAEQPAPGIVHIDLTQVVQTAEFRGPELIGRLHLPEPRESLEEELSFLLHLFSHRFLEFTSCTHVPDLSSNGISAQKGGFHLSPATGGLAFPMGKQRTK